MGIVFQRVPPAADALRSHFDTALREPPPQTQPELDARATDFAQQASSATSGTVAFNAGRFAIALAIFLFLLGLAIFLDWRNVVDDPKVYSGLAGTALGALLGFITGEATGSAT